MDQKEMLDRLNSNERQKKQFDAVAKMIDEAVKAEMPVFMKLVQFDVMAEMEKNAHADNVSEGEWEKQVTEKLDQFMKQFNDSLSAQVAEQFKRLQA